MRNHSAMARLRQHGRRASRILAGLLIAAPVIAESGITAHADTEAIYPGGCTVTLTVLIPNSCQFVNMASDPETVVLEGIGSVTISDVTPGLPCSSYTTSTWFPGRSKDLNEKGGCTYQLTFNIPGGGVASTSDPNLVGWGNCGAWGTNPDPVTNPSISCNYLALFTSGLAANTGTAIGTLLNGSATVSARINIEVDDTTFGTPVYVTSTPAFGFGAVTNVLQFPEQTGHLYQITVTNTNGSGDAFAAFGAG